VQLPMGHKDKKEFWQDHVKAASEFSGSDIDYCKLYGLHIRTFSSYKTRFGLTKKSLNKSQSLFVPVKLKTKTQSLPDPKWLAEFILEL